MVPQGRLTLDDVARFPLPGAETPQSIRFLSDRSGVTYLLPRPSTTTLELWAYDVSSGAARLLASPPGGGDAYSLEDELRRERTRQAWGGITAYEIAGGRLLVPHAGRIWHAPLGSELRPFEGADGAEDPRLFPDGQRFLCVLAGDLHLGDLATGRIQPLTDGAEPGFTHGLAEYAAQEELGRSGGFWIRPDGAWIAYAEVDERHVPLYPIVHQADTPVWTEEHRYPLAGSKNAHVRLLSVPASGGTPTVHEGRGEYLARVLWTPEGEICALWLDRAQQHAEWVLYRPGEPSGRMLLEETSLPWFNLLSDIHFLESGQILRMSENSGVPRLYLREPSGVERLLGDESGCVNQLLGVDAAAGTALYLGWDDDPTQRHVFSLPLSGGPARRLTLEPGWHQATFAPGGTMYVDQLSTPERPAATWLRRVDAADGVLLHHVPGIGAEELGIHAPEFVTLPAEDGTMLHGALYRAAGTASGKLPLIVLVYGGPHAQRVTKMWDTTCDLEAQYLAQHGYLVFRLDNRGSHGRGLGFEAPLHQRFGTVELEDQVAGVRWLAENRGADPERVGIYGWSYGGFMTLLALLKRPDVFRAGVSGAPVTDFRWYDTAYTERYMGLPQENGSGYDGAALPGIAPALAGQLLIIHGLVDENVHFRHTAAMVTALIEAGKEFELLLLPKSRHSVRGFTWKRRVAEARTKFLMAHV